MTDQVVITQQPQTVLVEQGAGVVVVVQQAPATVVEVVAAGPAGPPGGIVSSLLTGLSLVSAAAITALDTALSAFGKVQAQITANLATLAAHVANVANPHATTKAQVGLGNVDNTADTAKPVSTAQAAALALKANAAPVTGQVLQQLTFTDAGSSTASAALANVTGSAKSITPKSTNSTIIVECVFAASVSSGGAGTNTSAGFRLFNATAAADIGVGELGLAVVSGSGTNVTTQAPCTLLAGISNAALTAVSFTLRAHYTAAATTVSAGSQCWRITEVQN